MTTTTIPTHIRAVQVQPNKTVKVITIPFGEHDLVKNLPEDQIIVGIPSSRRLPYLHFPLFRFALEA